MSAPRASMRALRTLSGTSSRQSRSLHMTGPATYSSPMLTGDLDQTRRPRIEPVAEQSAGAEPRQFNTSRSLKAVHDSSTMDFAYLPELFLDSAPEPALRVPLLPSNFYPSSTKTSYSAEEEEILAPSVMKAEISLASADSTHVLSPSAFADVHDNGNVDFHGLAHGEAADSGEAADAEGGTIKQLWNGFLDDVLGPRKNATP